MLLSTTNQLVSDIQEKIESLNRIVDAVKDVGDSVNKFSASLKSITNEVAKRTEENKDTIAQFTQWCNVALELKNNWQQKSKKGL